MDKYRKIEFGLVGIMFVLVLIIFIFNFKNITGFVVNPSFIENAPSDYFSEDDLDVYPDRIIINLENYTISKYAFSGSMIPILNENSNGIGVKPESTEELNVGDIITFKNDEKLIVHRIIKIGNDSAGWYAITKGDNNIINDGKVRFEDIETRLVVLIY